MVAGDDEAASGLVLFDTKAARSWLPLGEDDDFERTNVLGGFEFGEEGFVELVAVLPCGGAARVDGEGESDADDCGGRKADGIASLGVHGVISRPDVVRDEIVLAAVCGVVCGVIRIGCGRGEY